jgi:hypothetical protein
MVNQIILSEDGQHKRLALNVVDGQAQGVRANPLSITARLKNAFPVGDWRGVAFNDYTLGSILLAPNADSDLAATIAAKANALSLSADTLSILADGVETATITCADVLIAADSQLFYAVWLDGEVYAEAATTPVTAGEGQLALSTELAGEYLVELWRPGAYEAGFIIIQAEEVD